MELWCNYYCFCTSSTWSRCFVCSFCSNSLCNACLCSWSFCLKWHWKSPRRIPEEYFVWSCVSWRFSGFLGKICSTNEDRRWLRLFSVTGKQAWSLGESMRSSFVRVFCFCWMDASQETLHLFWAAFPRAIGLLTLAIIKTPLLRCSSIENIWKLSKVFTR